MQVFVHAGGVGEKDCKHRLKKQPEIEGPEKKQYFNLKMLCSLKCTVVSFEGGRKDFASIYKLIYFMRNINSRGRASVTV